MKNFGTLYRYELKKLFKRKLVWGVALTLAAFMAYSARPEKDAGGSTLTLTNHQGETVSGYVSTAEQRKLRREGDQRISGLAMDEMFFQHLREASVGNGVYIIREQYDLDSYFYLIDSSYYMPHSMIAYDMGLDPAEITAEGFYQNRMDMIERQWNGSADDEIAYWRAVEALVEKPFVYRYMDGYQDILMDVFGLSNVIPLMAAICLCGVFSEERRTRADALIFSTKQGRFPQYLAKVLAGITAVLASSVLIIGADILTVFLVYGTDGFDAALQLWNITSSLPLTMGEASLIMIGLLLLYALLSGCVAMLLSAWTHNTVAALAGPILLVIVQSWLRLDIQAAEYLPNQLFNTIPSLRNFHLVRFFGMYWNNLQFGFFLYGILSVFFLALCWISWRRQAH